MSRMREKVQDYFAFGATFVRIIDPHTRMAEIRTAAGIHKAGDGILWTQAPDINVPFAELLGE